MTREKLKAHCERQIEMCEMGAYGKGEEPRGKIYEEHKLILELLEQESCDDAISRQAVLAAMRKNHRSGGRDIDGDYIEGDYRECLYDDIISLPLVTPGSTSCDVAISKQAAIDAVNTGNLHLGIVRALQSILAELPPVIPQPKIGKWIINGIGYSETYSYKLNCSCSVCGYKAVFYDHISSTEPCLENANYVHKFCPNCGFRMIESQESEDKE